jgi:hypothetical protein
VNMALRIGRNHYNNLLSGIGRGGYRGRGDAGGGLLSQAVRDARPNRTPRVIGTPSSQCTIPHNPLDITSLVAGVFNMLSSDQLETSNGEGREKGKGVGAHLF